MNQVISLASLPDNQMSHSGAKAAHLATMIQVGLPVPPGFVIMMEAGADELSTLEPEIFAAWDQLGLQLAAVRSSAVGEDAATTSWAGQLHTNLGVGRVELLSHIRQCHESVHQAHVRAYGAKMHTDNIQKVAVIVQSLVIAEQAGVLFTAHPVTGERDIMVAESIFGLGELLAQGQVGASHYEMTHDGQLLSTIESEQDQQLTIINNRSQIVALQAGTIPRLSAPLLEKLAAYGRQIETLFGGPQDIEWALEKNKIWILQARPITTL
ncbi:hypothetical protein IJJ08_05025 [bacterium]|nr:hypothetical protein [bacterium]